MKTARGKDTNKINKKFFDKWAKSYDNSIFSWSMRHVQRRVLEQTQINLRTSVLDIGCGTGYILLQLAETIKKGRIVGIDISSEMIKQASLKTENIKNIKIKKSGVEKIPYKKEMFDYVLTTDAFHHFKNADAAIKEMKRVTKENGTIIIADINIPPHFLTNLIFIEPGCVHLYSRKEMLELAEKHGLQIIKQKRVGLFFLITIMRKRSLKLVSR